MNKAKKQLIVNGLLFMIGVIASYQGAIHFKSWIGPLVVIIISVIHFMFNDKNWKKELLLVLIITLLTFFIESILILVSVYKPNPQTRFILFHPFAPLWITALWLNYSLRIKEYLPYVNGYLKRQFFTGAIFGFIIFGSLSRLKLVELPLNYVSIIIMSFSWGALMMLIYLIANKVLSSPKLK